MRPSLVGALYPHIVPPHVCVEGPTWTQNVMPDIRYHAITYGNGIFVAGGNDTTGSNTAPVATSPDGVTWTPQTGPTFTGPNPIQQDFLAFGNGVFVAGGSTLDSAWSTDAVTWHTVPAATWAKNYLYFGGGIFVGISQNDDKIRTSVDGQSWATRNLPANRAWLYGAFGNNRHIVVQGPNTAKSDDGGVTWSAGGSLPAGYAGRIAYGNGVWLVLNSGNANAVAYSLDNGDTWTALVISGVSTALNAVHFQQGVFLMLDNLGQTVQTSVDGINWTMSVHDLPNTFIGGSTDYAFNGGRRYAAFQATNPGTTIGAWGEC